MQNWQATILSQYSNSPILNQIIGDFNAAADPSININAFYKDVWNIQTAQGYGLDVWGRIVGVSRIIQVANAIPYFGFDEAGSSAQPYGQAPFWTGPPATTNYPLSDDAFRQLILIKALSNISNCSIQTYNQMLMQLFPNRGNCYVGTTGQMSLRLTFEFLLEPYEITILKYSGAFAMPTGVNVQIMDLDIPYVFGFAEAGYGTHGYTAPFNCGTFFKGFE
jgi:hypothetical protein